jgi:hypothetical protein
MVKRLLDPLSWLRSFWANDQTIRGSRLRVRSIASHADLPEHLEGDELVLVGTESNPKWAILQCPCGCGRRIDVNLMKSRRSFWRLFRSDQGITIWPSLWVPRDGCGSHFWIIDSSVMWARFVDDDQDWLFEDEG